MSLHFAPDTPEGALLRDWWLGLAERRGDRAELRRAATPTDAFIHPAGIGLIQTLRPAMEGQSHWEARLGALAGLSSHLNFDHIGEVLRAGSLAERMADKKGEGPIVSELRFRRLLQRERDTLYHPMIRILRMLDGRASLFGLANDWFYWGDQVRRTWALAYFPRLPRSA